MVAILEPLLGSPPKVVCVVGLTKYEQNLNMFRFGPMYRGWTSPGLVGVNHHSQLVPDVDFAPSTAALLRWLSPRVNSIERRVFRGFLPLNLQKCTDSVVVSVFSRELSVKSECKDADVLLQWL